MAERPFVHLHCHSEYSLLDGAGSVKRLAARAAELGMNALALTDHGNLYGIRKFYKAAHDAGIKPILGFEAYVALGSRFEKQGASSKMYHLTLLSESRVGFQNLMKLASKAFMEGFYYKPRIDRELLKEYSDGLIVLSGCLGGEVNQHLISGNTPNVEKALETIAWYKNVFGDRYYLEIQNNGMDLQHTATRHMIPLAAETGVPLVATSDVHYVLEKDSDTQDILLCINTGKYRTDTARMKMETNQFFLRSPEEMYAVFPGQEEAVARSQEIADRCNVELDTGKRFFPVFSPPEGYGETDYLRHLAYQGLRKNYEKEPKRWKDGIVGGELSDEVLTRLDTELGVIERQGYPNYFLIVWDFVRVAHERGISCTARGSGVGSLVCYGLGISRMCPLEYDLLFERFLDVNRKEAPDIDIDFERERRSEVLQYVKEKYGEANVAQIGIFGTMKAKAAIKDVGRVLGMPIPRVVEVTSKIPGTPKITLTKALEGNPDLRKLYEEDSEIHELVEYAKGCEGLARQAGTHACATVIAPQPVVEFVPMQVDKKGNVVTQWEGAEVEEAGLLKMDFLGLINLTILSETMNFIEQTTGRRLDPYEFPIDDKETYALLCRGESKGVFQLESDGMRSLLQRMRPDNLRDIIATLALYRPGPLEGGMVDTYINVKHHRQKAEYIHPVMKDVLEETYGVMVYQEQIMRIFNRLGKIELSSSYKCIKAISKKKHDIIAKFKAEFVEGCKSNGLTEKNAEDIFALIEKFAGYGFNKSHTTAYAKIAFMTAYLKTHYPVEFMAALLSGDISGRNFTKKDATVIHLEDCRLMGVEVVGPDVNTCEAKYRIEDGKIFFAMMAVKGCSEAAADAIREERLRHGPFTDIFNFCERVNLKTVPRSTMLTLLQAGAFDGFGAHRSQIEAVLDKAIQSGMAKTKDREKGQLSLFGFDDEEDSNGENAAIDLPDLPEWPRMELLNKEKEVLGYYRSGHPLAEHTTLLSRYCTHDTSQAKAAEDGAAVVLGGMITSLAWKTTRHGDAFASFEMEDQQGTLRATIWPDTAAEYRSLIESGNIVACVGRVEKQKFQNATPSKNEDAVDDEEEMMLEDDDAGASIAVESTTETTSESANFIIEKVISMESLKNDYNDGIALRIQEGKHTPETLKTLREILRSSPGSERVEMILYLPEHRVRMRSEMTVRTSPDLVGRVRDLLGTENVHVLTQKLQPKPREEKPWKRKQKS
ncbi:MAG: DNA polymerase III subunit alpha [Planctomycetia bacterium]|nr:DNA polymerase III subunit alpha [Planctomycetia bacterium]